MFIMIGLFAENAKQGLLATSCLQANMHQMFLLGRMNRTHNMKVCTSRTIEIWRRNRINLLFTLNLLDIRFYYLKRFLRFRSRVLLRCRQEQKHTIWISNRFQQYLKKAVHFFQNIQNTINLDSQCKMVPQICIKIMMDGQQMPCIIGLDYKSIGEVNHLLKTLDNLHISTSQQLLKIHLPINTLPHAPSIHKLHTHLLQEHWLLDQIDQRKVEIVNLQTRLPYQAILRFETIIRKLQKQLEKAQQHQLDLRQVLRKSEDQLRRMLKGMRNIQGNGGKGVIGVAGGVVDREQQELMSRRFARLQGEVSRVRSELQHQQAQWKKRYNQIMLKLIQTNDEVQSREVYVGELTRNVEQQKAIIQQLQEVQASLLDSNLQYQSSLHMFRSKINKSNSERLPTVQSDKIYKKQAQINPQSQDISLQELKQIYQRKLNDRTVKNLISLQSKFKQNYPTKPMSFDKPNNNLENNNIFHRKYKSFDQSSQHNNPSSQESLRGSESLHSNNYIQLLRNKPRIDTLQKRKKRYLSEDNGEKSEDEISLILGRKEKGKKIPVFRNGRKFPGNIYPLISKKTTQH